VVWNIFFFSVYWEIHGISSSQLTNAYFSEGLKPPTGHDFNTPIDTSIQYTDRNHVESRPMPLRTGEKKSDEIEND
jgi:hypothetical protein